MIVVILLNMQILAKVELIVLKKNSDKKKGSNFKSKPFLNIILRSFAALLFCSFLCRQISIFKFIAFGKIGGRSKTYFITNFINIDIIISLFE